MTRSAFLFFFFFSFPFYSVLACKYADEVIIGAPHVITQTMIKSLNISVVLHGKC